MLPSSEGRVESHPDWESPGSLALQESLGSSALPPWQVRGGGGRARMRSLLLLLLLLLLMMPFGVCGNHKAKCPLNLVRDQTDARNYYRPGHFFISGIISPKRFVEETPYNFSQTPFARTEVYALICRWFHGPPLLIMVPVYQGNSPFLRAGEPRAGVAGLPCPDHWACCWRSWELGRGV